MPVSERLQALFAANLKRIIAYYETGPVVWAVGVSGGADSLALVYLLKKWSDEFNVRVVALTVNHQLRPEAGAEAEYVALLMKKIGVEHHILHWEGQKPEKGIEEAAREARYGLLREWCLKHGVPVLLVAHNKRDQAETFLMRLQRGSGADGLAAMQERTERNGIELWRPLLNVLPEDLRAYLREQGVQWVEDPSNRDDDYLRVRIRKLLPVLEDSVGITVERLAATADRMARVRDYLESETEKFIKSDVVFWEKCGCAFSPAGWQKLHQELRLRVLAFLLKKIGENVYPPRMEESERLEAALLSEDFKNRTLGGCEIIKFGRRIWIVREMRCRGVLRRKEWDDYVMAHSALKSQKLPYKLRLALCRKEKECIGTKE